MSDWRVLHFVFSIIDTFFCLLSQLIGDALDEMVHDDEFSSISGHDVLIMRVAALHVVYMLNQSQVMWFGQLVSQKPGIMLSLKDKKSPDTSEMVSSSKC